MAPPVPESRHIETMLDALGKFDRDSGQTPSVLVLPERSFLALALEAQEHAPYRTLDPHAKPRYVMLDVLPSLAETVDAKAQTVRTGVVYVGDSFILQGPCGPVLIREERCDDCRSKSTQLLFKDDHHGGTKHVCADRDACHERSPG